jgi:hypothetical protein
MEEPLAFSLHIFHRYLSRAGNERFERIEKAAIEVNNVEDEMLGKRPEGLLGFNIFLPAILAIAPKNGGSAVQAVSFFSFPVVRQVKFFLKIATKNTVLPCIIPITVCIFYIWTNNI